MARPVSSLLDHPRRLEIDAALSGGTASVSELAAQFGVSRTSIYRYRSTHLMPSFRDQLRAHELASTSLVERLIAIAEDSRQARLALLEDGKIALHAQAANAEVRAIELLLDRLGVDSTDVADGIREGRAVAKAVRALALKSPSVAGWLAKQFGEMGEHELEQALRQLIDHKEVES